MRNVLTNTLLGVYKAMIVGYLEYGEVRIYRDLDSAVLEWNGCENDILSRVISFYTLNGNFLDPIPEYESRKGLTFRRKVSGLSFVEKSAKEAGEDELIYLLRYEATSLAENSYVDSLEGLASKVLEAGGEST
ncbi:hypothetical protein PSI07_21585 [Pseudoalteromonas sp. GABNS16A]|uniref:hypothetical protein n=2 Tax=unclassified Pseudoalteromonas TaxID=194690 RepID=UPI00235A3456|nr:hypothetical protein [Pseudoalteromonas sp. GABNS16A]MDC9575627.1 hypothetical protein [Pseudoalteromonas sp. GABNS16A]